MEDGYADYESKEGNPQHALKDKGVIDSRGSRHMTWNMSYLSDFEEINGGYVAFYGNSKGGNFVRGLPPKVFENNHTCVACKKGKQHRASFKSKPISSVSQPLQRLHMDLFGPTFVKILNKKSYCLVVTDDYSRFSWVFFLATKDETSTILKTFITGIDNQLSLKVKIIRSDNGTKFKNQDLNQFHRIKGIKKEFSVARTPQQNGIAERKNRTLIEAARTMLVDSLFLIPFWAEAVNTACSIQNRVLVTKPHNKTPYELLLGRTPSIDFMRPFACPVTILNTLDPLCKFDGKADEGFLVGYYVSNPQNTDDDATFKVKEPESEVYVSPSSSAKTKKHDDKNTREAQGKITAVGQNSTNSTNTFSAVGPSNTAVSPTFGKHSYMDPSQYPDDLNMPALEDISYSDDEEDVGVEANFSNLETTITISPIPITRVHKHHPVTQITGDLSSATQIRSTTRMVKDQATQIRSTTRMVKDQGGLTQINNDDFHTCMFSYFLSQEEPKREEGIDYEEVFALVARIEAIRLFLAYVSFMGFMVYQTDVKSAFLYETIEEEVYVCQPPGFEDLDYPDKRGKIDQTLFIKKQKVKQKQDEIFISQDKYVVKILRKFGLIDGKLASTPIDTEKPLLKNPDGEDVDVHTYSDYAGASLDMKSTTGGCQFLGCRLISWQCKKQTIVATSSTEAEYVAAASCCAQVLWIQNQLLDYGRKVIIIEDTHLNDAESIDCLPNEEIFAELARMGYEKPSTKLTFYKAFFSAQWKFLIHIIIQCMSAKRTAWNEFSSSMASAVICLATGKKFNFSKYIFDSLVRNVDSSSKFYMVGKGFSGLDTPLFEGMLVPQQVYDDVAANNVVADDVANDVADEATDVVAEDAAEPTPSLPTPATTPSSPSQQQQQPSQPTTISMDLLNTLLETCTTLTRNVEALERMHPNRGEIAELDEDEDVTLEKVAAEVEKHAKVTKKDANAQGRLEESQAQVYHIDLEHAEKVLSIQDDETEPAKLKEVIEVVTTTKLMIEVVTATATTISAAPSDARRRKGVIIRDPKEIATPSVIVHSEPKSKDKGKGIMVKKPKPLKKQAQKEQDEAYARELEAKLNANINWDDVIDQVKRKEKQDNAVLRYQALKRKPQTEAHARKNMMVYLKNMAGFKMDFFKGMSYNDIRPIFENHFNSIMGFLKKSEKELEEEASKALKRKGESSEQEDLEMLWQIVQERFASSKPKNFLDDFLLNTLKAMFEKPNVKSYIWKNQRGSYGLAKVKSWKLLESCGVHIITFTTTQMIFLVERRYPLIRFTLDQMLNNIRLEVKEESEVSLELLRFVRRQQQEGYMPDFGVDAVKDFKEYTLRDYYYWLKTYCCLYKLKLLDNAVNSRLRLLEESVVANEKIKK
nr:putative ribonuclease H-like domain-containing protein [Tanacetum cinerariifolium]